MSLTPSATEIIAALGATDQLVGVDDYSTYPASVAKLPKVGTFLQPNLEAVMTLRPTLVIADDVHAAFESRLSDAGIAAVECPMHDLKDVRESFAKVGKAIGRDAQARDQLASIDRAISAARARHHDVRPRVLAVIDHEPDGLRGLVVAGPGSWLDELLAIEGADNAMAGAGTRYPQISSDEATRAQPTIVVDVAFSADPATAPQLWGFLAGARIVVAKEPFLQAPSPRVAQALAKLDEILYPQ
ncbi:MAG TPA: helical backbone metal receptor [Kofleriaceae bacterium]|nr:helical backbone metal receptor [Kofleriaceae bacterium]